MSDPQLSTPASSSKHAAPAKPKPKRAPQQSKTLRGRPTDPLPTRVSKTLAFLLRHGAEKEGLGIRPDGYLLVDELLAHPSLKLANVDLAQLRQIVDADAKSRYTLTELPAPSSDEAREARPSTTASASSNSTEGGGRSALFIRANQGHSLDLAGVEAGMRRVTKPEEAGLAVHGTYERHWPSIYETGLQKMTRQHIHVALALPPAPASASPSSTTASIDDAEPTPAAVVSGIRPSADLLIYLDVSLLISQGVPLFLSDNNVLLSPGDPSTPGSIGHRFFLRAVRRSGDILWAREGAA